MLFPRRSDRWAITAAAMSILLGAGLVLVTAARTSITVDEPYFYAYGRRIVFAGTFARPDPIDDSKLPVSALNVLPEWAAARFGIHAPALAVLQRWFTEREATYVREHAALYAGRLVTLVFYVALCWLVFACGREMYGASGALAATLLIAFLPTVLGHAALVTVDTTATCTLFAAVYAWTHCLAVASPRAVLIAGLSLGVAQLVKYTAVELVPIACIMLLVRTATVEPGGSRWRVLRDGAGALGVAGVIAIVVIDVGFAFQGIGVRLADLPCHSGVCRSLRDVLGAVPLPLPYEYLNGLDLVIWHDADRSGGNVYLLGKLSSDGFASYYAVATVLKTPLPFLALLLTRPWRRKRLGMDLMLLTPVLWWFVHFSFFFRSQVGLRFFLPAFPFLALLAGSHWDAARPRALRMAASVILGLYVIATVVQCPRYLSYFNVLIGRRLNAYRYLADSNLDWGQDVFALWAWEQAHAGQAYALEPYFPAHGRVIVRANDFLGITDPDAYAWLRARATPVATIGDSYLVFDVGKDGEGR